METWWERALILQIYWMLSRKYTFEKVNDPKLLDAAANGQFILVQRDVYESVGGHLAIANELLEDVALARLVKRNGSRLYFASGLGIVRTRMYRSFGAMWEGWTKNLYALTGGSLFGLIGELVDWFVLLAAGGFIGEDCASAGLDHCRWMYGLVSVSRSELWHIFEPESVPVFKHQIFRAWGVPLFGGVDSIVVEERKRNG